MSTFFRIFLSVLAGIPILMGCGDKIQPGFQTSRRQAAVPVETAQAEFSVRPIIYEAIGTVRAKTTGVISSKLMGTVLLVHVREGDRVRSGQILVEIDSRMVEAQRRQTEAALAEAKSGLEAAMSARKSAQSGASLALATYRRYVNLMATHSASKQEFDEIQARHLQAEAALAQAQSMVDAATQRVRQAESAVSAARVTDGDARIPAPYDGIITARLIEPGSLASPGSPLLGMESNDGYRVDILLPENHIASVQPNQTIPVQISSLDNLTLDGTVHTIFPIADSKSRSFQVQVHLPAHSGVVSGLFARAMIPLTSVAGVWIPRSALIVQGQLTGLYQVDADQKARFRLVRTGRMSETEVEILSGLVAGAAYVKTPPPNLSNGMTVEDAS